MPKQKTVSRPNTSPEGKRLTVEGRENQCIALAYDLVYQRLLDGTATSQETTHFLKMGSTKERLEKQILEEERKLKQAKTEAIERDKRIEALYEQAIEAVKHYRGYSDEEEYYDEDI